MVLLLGVLLCVSFFQVLFVLAYDPMIVTCQFNVSQVRCQRKSYMHVLPSDCQVACLMIVKSHGNISKGAARLVETGCCSIPKLTLFSENLQNTRATHKANAGLGVAQIGLWQHVLTGGAAKVQSTTPKPVFEHVVILKSLRCWFVVYFSFVFF